MGNTETILRSFHSPPATSLGEQVSKTKSKENFKLGTSILPSTILPLLFSELVNILQHCTSSALSSPLIKENTNLSTFRFYIAAAKPIKQTLATVTAGSDLHQLALRGAPGAGL